MDLLKITKKPIFKALIVLIISLINSPSQANDIQCQYDSANSLYTNAKFELANAQYQAILANGYTNSNINYNLGNTFFRMGEYSQAILQYEKALKIDPSLNDVRFNLNCCQTKIKDHFELIPQSGIEQGVGRMQNWLNSTQWAILNLAILLVFVLVLFAYLISLSYKFKKISFLTCLFLVLLFISSLLLALAKQNQEKEVFAIIMQPNCKVYFAPELQSAKAFELNSGTKVEYLDKIGSYYKIKSPDGALGWIKKENAEEI